MGALFFGHPQAGIFTPRSERLLVGIAAQAAIAIDNARLFRAAQKEIEVRSRTEAALRESEARRVKPDLKVIFATGAEGVIMLQKPYDTAALDMILRAAGERRGVTR